LLQKNSLVSWQGTFLRRKCLVSKKKASCTRICWIIPPPSPLLKKISCFHKGGIIPLRPNKFLDIFFLQNFLRKNNFAFFFFQLFPKTQFVTTLKVFLEICFFLINFIWLYCFFFLIFSPSENKNKTNSKKNKESKKTFWEKKVGEGGWTIRQIRIRQKMQKVVLYLNILL